MTQCCGFVCCLYCVLLICLWFLDSTWGPIIAALTNYFMDILTLYYISFSSALVQHSGGVSTLFVTYIYFNSCYSLRWWGHLNSFVFSWPWLWSSVRKRHLVFLSFSTDDSSDSLSSRCFWCLLFSTCFCCRFVSFVVVLIIDVVVFNYRCCCLLDHSLLLLFDHQCCCSLNIVVVVVFLLNDVSCHIISVGINYFFFFLF